jgi:MFS family permease
VSDVQDRLPIAEGELPVQQELVDRILLFSAVYAVLLVGLAQVRAMSIGWSPRDSVQLSVTACVVALAVLRKRVELRVKVGVLVLIFFAGGMTGLASLGMLGGTVIFFPTVVVLVALWYPPRTVLGFALLVAMAFCVVAGAFCAGVFVVRPSADRVMRNWLHWVTYTSCVLLCISILCTTILGYRRQVGQLLGQVRDQRDRLAKTNADLVAALRDVKRLSGLIPICSSCKRIRDDKGYWEQLESFLHAHSDMQFSHGICPECMDRLYGELMDPTDPTDEADGPPA